MNRRLRFRRAALAALAGLACLGGGPEAGMRLHFEDGTAASGVDFLHVPTRTARRFLPEIMGSGLVVADFNRDGAPDLVLVNSGAVGAAARPPEAATRLYINDGKGRFRDETAAWGLPSPGYGMGAAAGDFDNDGWTDLFLTEYAGQEMLLRNQGGRFVDVTRKAGIVSDHRWSTSAGFFDLEGDGDLDLWVVRYVDYTAKNAVPCFLMRTQVYCTPHGYRGIPSRLWRNNGDGTFTDASASAGISASAEKGLALVIGDIDQDGDPDVYVANDSTPNNLWVNDGRGGLRDVALAAGVALSELGREEASMGADMSDIDGDGRLDIAVPGFQLEPTSIYRQDESLIFREVSDAVGVGQSSRARLKWGVDFFDADNDGDEDLLVASGHIFDNMHAIGKTTTFEQQNTLYENLGGRFRDVSDAAGPALAQRGVNRGLATGDLDGDGDLDFVVIRNGGKAQVGVNQGREAGRAAVLWLEGRRANRSAIGARVVARVGGRTLIRQVHGASSYLSMCDLRVHVGLGPATVVDELTIHWPGSRMPQVIKGLPAGHHRIVEGQAPVAYLPGAARIAP